MKKLITRTLTGSVFVALTIGSLLWDPYCFAGLFLVFCVLGFVEFFRLFRSGVATPRQSLGIAVGVISYMIVVLVSRGAVDPVWTILILPMILLPFIAELYRKSVNPFLNIALTLLPVLYIALPMAMLSFLFNRWGLTGEFYPNILVGFFVIIWTGDTMAYLGGMALGRHPLFERISPKKTWEGSIVGAIFSLGMAAFLSIFFKEFTIWQWMGMAAVIVFAGTFGDLVESMLKRSTGVKDSGTLLPGHGGVLDRFDGVLFCAPFIFLYIVLINYFS